MKPIKSLFTILVCVVCAVPMVVAQSSDHADVAIEWFNLQLELVETTPGFSPPVASRAFGYSGVTLYEAVVPGMPDYLSLGGQLNQLGGLPQPSPDMDYHWPTVANSALATITFRLFAHTTEENKAAIEALYERFASEFEPMLAPDVFSRSETQGQIVAEAIFTWSLTDGGHEGELTRFQEDYIPPVGDGLWLPTPRTNGDPLPALQPYWGNTRPFMLTSGDACAPPPPPMYSEESDSAFYQEALEVYETVERLTPEQMAIARFWADDPGQTATPPGHSLSILTQVLQERDAAFEPAAEAYARLGIALADSFIACWHVKYQYNLLRPITYIQNVVDPQWMPVINTPPFPEYPSGHSVQSGAAAQVLADLFGENVAFVDHTHDGRGFAPRSFNSFSEFADEAAISRLYGGIHYRAAIEEGLAQGRCIGARVNNLVFRLDRL